MSDFSALQTWRSEADGELIFYIFDMLWYEGFDLMPLPLSQRHEILNTIHVPTESIRISEKFETGGEKFFELARQLKLEGIIAKKSNSSYMPGIRSKEWLKIKTEQHQEALIAGYTINENSSKKFSALLMGVYHDDELEFIGPVGTGFTNKLQQEILDKLKPLETKKCPFKEVPEYNKPSRFRPNPPKAKVIWVKPKLVADISYRTLTPDGSMRHPSFRGLREDKTAKEAVKEKQLPTENIIEEKKITAPKKLFAGAGKKQRKTLLNPKDETQTRPIEGHELKFTNLGKMFWTKKEGGGKPVTKRDMINYYYQVAPYMLPYMKDRPQTLNRHPHGIHGESFYQKNVTGKVPDWIDTFPYHSKRDGHDKSFLVCTDEASLLYIASLGCIEMNPWSSRVQSPDHPDWCIIDLDPATTTFEQVIQAARVTKKILDAIDVSGYCKTSGSKGLHIYIPLAAKYDYEQSKEFARVIARLVHEELPSFTSIERLTERRGGKMYIDFLQNRPQATLAGPYSLRPRMGAPVSMPLDWSEVKKGLSIQQHNIHNTIDRLKETGDLFKPVLGKGINLNATLKKIERIFDVQAAV
jgi:bifunctional non-homologous end joining protein LigD